MTRRWYVSLGVGAWVALSLTRAAAQPSSGDKALAIQLFDDAEKLMAAGNLAAACPKYSESQRRDPQLGTLLHLADCQEKVGKTASAWGGFKEATEIAARRNAVGLSEPREQIARARATALEPKIARLTIVVPPTDISNLEIRQDGEILGRAEWGSAMPVDPGTYVISAQAQGKRAWSKVVEIRSNGARIEVKIPRLEDEGAPGAAVPFPSEVDSAAERPPNDEPLTAPPRSSRGNTQRTIGYVAAGIGAVSMGVGVAFGFTVNSLLIDRDAICPSGQHCTREDARRISELEARAQSSAVACNVALAIGGALSLGGIALVLTAPSRGATSLRVGTWGGPNSAGASLQGGW